MNILHWRDVPRELRPVFRTRCTLFLSWRQFSSMSILRRVWLQLFLIAIEAVSMWYMIISLISSVSLWMNEFFPWFGTRPKCKVRVLNHLTYSRFNVQGSSKNHSSHISCEESLIGFFFFISSSHPNMSFLHSIHHFLSYSDESPVSYSIFSCHQPRGCRGGGQLGASVETKFLNLPKTTNNEASFAVRKGRLFTAVAAGGLGRQKRQQLSPLSGWNATKERLNIVHRCQWSNSRFTFGSLRNNNNNTIFFIQIFFGFFPSFFLIFSAVWKDHGSAAVGRRNLFNLLRGHLFLLSGNTERLSQQWRDHVWMEYSGSCQSDFV